MTVCNKTNWFKINGDYFSSNVGRDLQSNWYYYFILIIYLFLKDIR